MNKLFFAALALFFLTIAGTAAAAQPRQSPEKPASQNPDQEKAKQPANSQGSSQQKPSQPVPFEDQSKKEPDVPSPAVTNNVAKLDPKTPLAEVNGQKITKEDLDRLIEFANPQAKIRFESDAGKKDLLQNIVETRSFYLEALGEKMDQDPELQARIELLRQQILASTYVNRELKKIVATDADLRSYYDEHKKDFEIPESVNASHILVKTEEEAREIKKQLEAGADFAELARQKSLDTTNKNDGGKMGFFIRGAMLPPFEEAAFKLKPGQISDPVKTTFGWHIIKVLDVRPRSVMPFDEAKKMIQARVQTQKQQNWLQSKKAELRSKYGVKIYDNLFAAPPQPAQPKATSPFPGEGARPKSPEDKKPIPPAQ
ncbi:MAG TPA: peptidyl-prolyl cis-trans isomerase [Acidobacteriota bacterium]